MSKWFSKAANVFKANAEEIPHPFELTCECSVRHAGLRKRAPQRIVCRECGTSLFVLPRDAYPAPKPVAAPPPEEKKTPAPESKPRPKTESAPELEAVESILDEVVILDDPSAKNTRKLKAKVKETGPPPPPPNKIATRVQPVGFWRPYQFILGAIGLVVLVTIYIVSNARAVERAKITFQEESEKGFAAFNQKDWVTAKGHLAMASDAADVLEREDEGSRRVRQFRWETTAITDLASQSLVDILEEAERTLPDNYGSWHADFQAKYGGRWLVLELPMKLVTPEGKNASPVAQVQWNIPIGTGQRPIEFEPLPVLSRLGLDETPRPVVVGVQLESITWETAHRKDTVGKWVVRFSPEHSVLWTDMTTYEGAGMTFDDDIRPRNDTEAILQKQRVALGLETPVVPAAEPESADEAGEKPQETT
jgi:hypothetical protein